LTVILNLHSQPVAPGHSFLFGHLLYFKGYLDRLPEDAHYHYAPAEIGMEHFAENGAYYIDLWPMTGSTLIITSPKIGTQVTQTNPRLNCKRPKLLSRFFLPITGGPTMFDIDEAAWKPWRAVFNKGFHSDHINSLVPGIVEEVSVYANTLRAAAEGGNLIFLEPITLRFMMDIIGKTILYVCTILVLFGISHLGCN
jgi:cytochrome P450